MQSRLRPHTHTHALRCMIRVWSHAELFLHSLLDLNESINWFAMTFPSDTILKKSILFRFDIQMSNVSSAKRFSFLSCSLDLIWGEQMWLPSHWSNQINGLQSKRLVAYTVYWLLHFRHAQSRFIIQQKATTMHRRWSLQLLYLLLKQPWYKLSLMLTM